MPAIVIRIGRWVAAILLFAAGLLLSVPGVPGPGFVVIVLGLVVLLPESRWLRKKYVHFKRKHPRLFRWMEERRQRHRLARIARRERRATRERQAGLLAPRPVIGPGCDGASQG